MLPPVYITYFSGFFLVCLKMSIEKNCWCAKLVKYWVLLKYVVFKISSGFETKSRDETYLR